MTDISNQPWDTLIRGALVFDGTGAPPVQQDIAIRAGKIAARGEGLPAERANEVVDASGLWLMPGLLDIHTHLDLEVEINPALPEVVRHGTTSVIVGNCSLGAAFGAQAENGENAVIDCFTRVENMPKRILRKCTDRMDWHDTAGYVRHFGHLPLGPNIGLLLPHSMLRVQVMGIEDSVSRAPTRAERKQMYELLDGALNQGFLGLSTDALPFHYLANAPHKEKRIPTQWSDETELRELLGLVREKDRVWQATPDSHDRAKTLRRFAWTRKRGFGKPLRVSALVCLDFPPVPGLWRGMLAFAALMNSKLMGGKFHFQALSQNFRIWADGIVAPIFEELPSTRKLIEFEADDREGRRALLSDPAFAEEFKRDIALAVPATRPKFGNPTSFLLDPPKMFVDSCPVPEWNGTSMAALMRRVADYQSSGGKKGADSPREAKVLASFPPETKTLGEFLLHALRLFDTDFRWWTDIANTRREVADRILFDPNTMPGFNDSGAHITNMAFFDGNLVTLQRAQTYGLEKVAYAVKRLTRDPARFFGTRAGTLEIGAQADVILLDPQALARHDGNQSRRRIYSELLENDVLVNRSDGVVREVYISGARVWENGNRFTQALGKERLGKVLTFTPRKE